MNDHQRYREQIDACRPGSDDLALPALAELAQAAESDRALADELERSQRFDRSVAATMHDVPVPAGLLQRLLDRVSEPPAARDDESSSVPQPTATVEIAEPAGAAHEHRHSRRLWLRATAGLAAAAAIAGVAVIMWPRPLPTVTPDQLATRAGEWMTQVAPQAGWTQVTTIPAHFPQGTLRASPESQKPLRTAEGWSGTAYQCRAGGAGVTLFVFPSPPAEVRVSSTPFTRLPASQGRSMAAWMTGGVLYVVVIDDPRLPLEHVIRTPRTV